MITNKDTVAPSLKALFTSNAHTHILWINLIIDKIT
jgi:hypothetical protein